MNLSNNQNRKIILMLCNVRSAQNVGAIFRTSDAVGVSQIILGGYTPSPVDRFGRTRKNLIKASLGAEKVVPWAAVWDYLGAIKKMKKSGCYIVAVEQSSNSIDYRRLKLPARKDVLLIVGNEINGLGKNVMRLADAVAEIPMKGEKESLNVSVATGVILYGVVSR